MEFNTDKCKIPIQNGECAVKNCAGQEIIGVIINSKLSWLPNARMISKCTNYKKQFPQGNRIFNRETKLQCYKTYVRPFLECTSSACYTNNKSFVEKIESVQTKAAIFIMNVCDRGSSVTNMINELNLDSIELRQNV